MVFTAIEQRTDDRIVRARRSKLDHVCGRITDGRDYHLLIGKKIADLGIEGGEELASIGWILDSLQVFGPTHATANTTKSGLQTAHLARLQPESFRHSLDDLGAFLP